MAQRNRHDEPGAWLHVMNRGVARRTVFERREDMRYFLALLARMVRAGLIEVHAYCLLATHFHLLLRSLVGETWRAMRYSQNSYVRRFNRQRKRDGPLFRGRFRSKRVTSERYWITLVRYIDDNSRAAGLVASPGDYPYGSAWHHRRAKAPRWLSRQDVVVRATDGVVPFTPDLYDRVYGAPLTEAGRRLIELRLSASIEDEDPFDDLVGSSPVRVAEWMRRKARVADGTRPGLPVVSAATMAAQLADVALLQPEWTVTVAGSPRPGIDLLGPGLLRLVCGLSLHEVAIRLHCSAATVGNRVQAFRHLVATDDAVLAVAADVVGRATDVDWPYAGEAPPSCVLPAWS